MECRKHGVDIGGRRAAHAGEVFHSDGGKHGSLMRFCGLPAWKVLGLECIGWCPGNSAHFRTCEVVNSGDFPFPGPQPVDLLDGDSFCFGPDGKPPLVGGHDCDVRPSLVRAITKRSPETFAVPGDPQGVVSLARCATHSTPSE